MRPLRILAFAVLLLLPGLRLLGQFSESNPRVGFDLGGTLAKHGVIGDDARSGFRAYLRYVLLQDFLQAEVGGGGARFSSRQADTRIVPFDVRLLIGPHLDETWNPFAYVGYGYANYNVVTPSPDATGGEFDAWAGILPFGVGLQLKPNKDMTFALDLNIGGGIVMADEADGYKDGENASYFAVYVGYEYLFDRGGRDSDGDGLADAYERKIGSDPNNRDTDGDGLSDGAEVLTHKTDPLNPDSDGDGLTDGAEVNQHRTNPLNPDTDGDGLRDGEEVMTYHTNPLRADTDGDGLKDGEEVLKYKTDPLKPDTDGDGLKDGEEVLTHKTDPLNRDTDGDSISDGEEVLKYKTNPLNRDTDGDRLTDDAEIFRVKTDPLKPDTDGDGVIDSEDRCPLVPGVISAQGCPAAEAPKKGTVLNFSDIYFIVNTDQFDTTRAETGENLKKLFAYVQQCDGIIVMIEGHASREGNEKRNQQLSELRAARIKTWLVEQGVSPAKIAGTQGFGSKRNAVTEPDPKSAEAKNMDAARLEGIRKQNRRIAMRVVKGCD